MTFNDLMQGFGVVTAMDLCIWTPNNGYNQNKNCCSISNGALSAIDFRHDPADYIDTMKITNINQEGPTKTITGGRYAAPLIKYGKTTTLEANDALGRASTLVKFFGAKYNGGSTITTDLKTSEMIMGDGEATKFSIFSKLFATEAEYKAAGEITLTIKDATAEITEKVYNPVTQAIDVTLNEAPLAGDVFYFTLKTTSPVVKEGTRISFDETFPGPFAIQGITEFVDKNGEKVPVYIFIPQFYPNGIFNLTQDTEGDAAVFDLSGTLIPTTIQDGEGTRTIIYEIRSTPFFTQE